MKKIWENVFGIAVDYLISVVIIIGTAVVFTATFEVRITPMLWLYIAVFTLVSFLMFKVKRGKIIAAAVMIALFLFVIILTDIKESFYNVISACSERYEQTYMYYFVEPRKVSSSDATGAMMLISSVFSLVMAWSVEGKSMGLWPGALLTLGTLGFVLAVQSTPNVFFTAAVVMGWITLFFVRRFRKNSKTAAPGFTACMFLICAIVGAAVIGIIKPDMYVRSPETDRQRNAVIAEGIRLAGKLGIDLGGYVPEGTSGENAGPGGTSYVYWTDNLQSGSDLKTQRNMTRTGTTILRVRTDNPGRVYLRGYSLGRYDDGVWTNFDVMSEGLNPMFFTTMSLPQTETYVMDIETEAVASNVAFMPYYSLPAQWTVGGSSNSASDGYVTYPGRADSYSVNYVPYSGDFSDALIPSEYADNERAYRQTKNSVYLQLPSGGEDIEEALLDIAAENGIYPGDENVISLVAEYIRTCASYNLNAPELPEGEDFALYFLRESHSGYCVHFATAATLMYRALGVPARYVSGFMFDIPEASAGDWYNVTDYAAHAWVEVYMDGVGWVPVEVTASAGGSAADEPEEETTEPETPVQEEPVEEETPKEDSSFATSYTKPVGETGMEEEPAAERSFSAIWLIPAALVIIVLVLLLMRPAVVTIRRLRLARGDISKAMKGVYLYSLRLIKAGAQVDEAVEETYLKDAYSRYGITRTELENASSLTKRAALERFNELKDLRKFVFKYLKCLI